jgi:predicted methyltransferase
MIWTSENYHDLHNKSFGSPDMLLVDRALLAALKSGGVLMIEDHAAVAGSGARDTDTLHRIDPELVKKEAIAAGFLFVGESKALRNKEDPHNAKAREMHDRTDRFLLKFRKP